MRSLSKDKGKSIDAALQEEQKEELKPEENDDTLIKTVHASFSMDVLIKQFVLHMFLPFSIPFYLMFSGHGRGAKQELYLNSFASFLLSYFIPSTLWICTAIYFVYPDEMQRDGIYGLELVALYILHAIRSLMIACKYGSLRRDEYNRFMNSPDVQQAKRWRNEIQLISGWLYPWPSIIYSQLKMAAVLHDLDLRHAQFIIKLDDTSIGNWRDFLSGAGSDREIRKRFENAWPNYEASPDEPLLSSTSADMVSVIPAFHVLLSVIFRSLAVSTPVMRLCFLMAVFRCAIPRISAIVLHHERIMPLTAPGIIFFVLQCIQTLLLYYFTLSLMQLAVVHYRRQYRALATLGHLARNHPDEHPDVPMIDMKIAENVRAWTFLRIALQHFGSRYAQRIKIYTASAFLILLAIIVVTVSIVGTADNRTDALHNPFTYFCLQDVFGMGVMMSVTTYFGSEANQQYFVHKAYLTRHVVEDRQVIATEEAHGREPDLNFLRVVDYLETAIRLLKGLDDGYFITVLGVRAEPALASSFVTVFGSILVMLASQYLLN